MRSFKERLHRIAYATDASAYRELPCEVSYPESPDDLVDLLIKAKNRERTLIVRGAGTSLAGQVVGDGIVADISRSFNKIIEINAEERWVRVEPGVILDELNIELKRFDLFFAPETSTSNRCTIGGMVGNNSCGSHSLVYGSTRDHLLEAKVILSDGSFAHFKSLSDRELKERLGKEGLEGEIYRELYSIISDEKCKADIVENYPHPSLRRRNTGYALDELINDGSFNLCKLLAGSEGTLALGYEFKLNLLPIPKGKRVLLCAHCSRLSDTFKANLIALKYKPLSVEMMDRNILELSKKNISQNRNRFFVKDDPESILIVELYGEDDHSVDEYYTKLERELVDSGLVYHCSRVEGASMSSVWELRKAGLGLLTSMKGDSKPVSVIEDTAVAPEYLPDYLEEFDQMLKRYGLSAVYHAHIGTGELHLRPILNLKSSDDILLFRKVANDTAHLVKRYRGSLSGEHGDGRLRGEFIPILLGEGVYSLLVRVKRAFDPGSLLNKGKIIDTPAMDVSLRYSPGRSEPDYKSYFDFSAEGGWLRATEQCNGSGDCRKSSSFKGVMCPSYQASGDETYTTRARANILRELLTNPTTKKVFDQKEIYTVLEYCVSCKGCLSECPSNVDMTKYKAEFLQHRYDISGTPLNVLMISHMSLFQKAGSLSPWLYNLIVSGRLTSPVIKYLLRFDQSKKLPEIYSITLKSYIKKHLNRGEYSHKLHLFADEFTNYIDVEIGVAFVELMNELGYEVIVPDHVESGRASLSKGMLRRASRLAKKNVEILSNLVTDRVPLVGLEPSTILSFRDEYPMLLRGELKERAEALAKNAMLYDEFIMREVECGNIKSASFTREHLKIRLHGHCHQKALAFPEASARMLSLPENYSVETIESGCCGMAGAFGYEKEHSKFSKDIGETKLFPELRKCDPDVVIAAPGTSCREQIKEGTGIIARHPVEILRKSLISK